MTRVVRIHEYRDASVLKIEDIEVPAPSDDESRSRSEPSGSIAPK
jgi:hypothetical protein